MKKFILSLVAVVAMSVSANAQKFALVDMEYILKNIPAYEMANEHMVFLTDEQKKAKEQEIVAKEKEVTDLKYKYFGPQGELFKKRESLIKPIQDDVYNAVKKVSEERGYQAIFDRASSQSIIFASPRIDVSNLVLEKLGYAK